MVKNLAPNAEDTYWIPGSGRSPGEGNGNPLQYFLPGESHEQRSLAGYGLRSHKELNMTEWLNAHVRVHAHHIPWLDAPVLCLLSWRWHVESFSHWVIHQGFFHNPSSFLLAHLPQSLKHICVGLGNNFKAALSWVTCHYTLLTG